MTSTKTEDFENVKTLLEQYKLAVDKSTILSKSDLSGKITYANEQLCKISGYSKEELVGKQHNILRHPDMPKEAFREMWETIRSGKIWKGVVKNKGKNGDTYIVDATIIPIIDSKGNILEYIGIRHDITAQELNKELLNAKIEEKTKDLQDAFNRLEITNQKINEYVELIDKNIIISSTDLYGIITYASNAFSDISGYAKEELVGQPHSIVRHPDMQANVFKEMWETIKSGKIWSGEVKNKKKDGGYYWVFATITPNFDKNGEITGYTSIRHDITDKIKIRELSITDNLTSVYNRRFFNTTFPKELSRAKRDNKYLTLAIFDVDFFKLYNDTYGHKEGDKVLKKVAKTIKSSLNRSSDYIFRIGGEEFAIIFCDLDEKKSFILADTLRKNIEELEIEHKSSPVSKYLTISLGLVTRKGQEIHDGQEMHILADKALYEAKHNGRNRIIAHG